jgi:hypothetical protein
MKKDKITAISIASGLKILIGIYLWLNFFDVLPGNFKNLTMTFFCMEFIEHALFTIHKEIYKNNFWEADVEYNTLFYSTILDLFVFWVTYILIIYSNFMYRYGWIAGILVCIAGIIAILIFYWFSQKFAKFIVFVINEIKITKTFNDSLNQE